MASSVNPQTGLSEIGPLKILAWWALWWGPALLGVLSWLWVFLTGPLTANSLHSVVQLNAILLALEVVSLLCIITTVAQISTRPSR